jgi:CDP-glucose 4,6-dehydratase
MVSTNILTKSFSGKRVFVTGHTGFKGTWLIKILNSFGAIVRGYALDPLNKTNLYEELNGFLLCDSVIGDLRDRGKLKSALLDFEPDYVFHLAAQPLVRLSYELPSETFEVNAIGTANLLDSIRFLENKCTIVLITTDKVYHNNEWDYPYRENDRLGGYDPYSASKACSELVIDSFRNSFFNLNNYDQHLKALAVARAGNVIGGGDWSKDRLLPDIAKALSANNVIDVRNPKSIRPWQHVVEPLFGYLVLAVQLNEDPFKFSGSYNFGPNIGDTLSVEEMTIKSIECWGFGSYKTVLDSNNFHEAGLLKLDINKSINQLNWKPVFSAQLAIERTINWYKKYYDGAVAADLIKLDIEFYQNIINEKKY